MSGRVERTRLAAGLEVSRVITGLWQVADMERGGKGLDLAVAARAMQKYVDAGLTTFDMADHYGSAEDIAGVYVDELGGRGRVELQTKWVPEPGPITREDVRAAVSRALRRLRVERVDLMQFHTWSYSHPAWLDALSWLQELVEEGVIGALGVTNFDAAHLRVALASGIRVVSNQVSYSLVDQRAAGALAGLCAEHEVKILAYGTLAGGFLSERWLGRPDPHLADELTWSQLKYRRFIEEAGGWDAFQALLRTLAAVAARTGTTIPNLASRYILDSPGVAAVIIGARLGESEHIASTLELLELRLDAESRAEIAAALGKLTRIPGDTGDEYRRPPYLTASGDLSHHVAGFPAPYAVKEAAGGRRQVLSGTPWETLGGYARAVRVGDRAWVSGTTATHGDKVIGGTDAAAQFHFAVDKLAGALESLGGRLEDVVRTRVFVADLADWEAVARAHGVRFGEIMPANTLVRAELVGSEYLVEVEAEAVLTGA